MIHHLIVPGVGGSDEQHWQSWLQRQLPNSSRVEQDWQQPILQEWIEQWVAHVEQIQEPIQVIAHSFGCLTSLAALVQYPALQEKINNLILVAPANPARFSSTGFAQAEQASYLQYFEQLRLELSSLMLISENDPWLALDDALYLAELWKFPYLNMGQVGHINVASGFGAFPQILPFIEQPYFSPCTRMRCSTQALSH
ncbi:RBBP9/YdeN family alpha/beta hydrolase [Acinetobacter brisouii]|uniref:RBBP9/YdeN family alpha/beta hydrolase n=1 Tax=Acinetobacter brisouii TaxID=396323 RepID=UPI001250B6F3|nr:alpha/beta hydrolase [Acinetobacter brisouii]